MQITGSVKIAQAVRWEFRSEVNHRHYSVSVAMPLIGAPDTGCPVLYVLDGDWYFASAVEVVRANAPGVAVVGLGYPHDDRYVERVIARHQPLPAWAKELPAFRVAVGLERRYDLTLPSRDDVLAKELSQGAKIGASDVGGLDSFLKVLETEIRPWVETVAKVNLSNQAIFGHSLGGLAVLHALFLAPDAFRTFIASSPSIWWNEKAVLGGEGRFADVIRRGGAGPRLLVTVGSEEETPDPKLAANAGIDFAEHAIRVRSHRMIGNARELVERLRAAGGSGFEAQYCAFPGQHHGISPWSSLGHAVLFAFPRQ